MSDFNLIETKDNQWFYCFESNTTPKTYHFYLSDRIDQPQYYVEMIHKIRTSDLEEIVKEYENGLDLD